MTDYSKLMIRIPAEVEKLLKELSLQRKTIIAAEKQKERLAENKDKIVNSMMENGASEEDAIQQWDNDFDGCCTIAEVGVIAFKRAAENVADWWSAVDLPF
jgi:phosphotransacetylase